MQKLQSCEQSVGRSFIPHSTDRTLQFVLLFPKDFIFQFMEDLWCTTLIINIFSIPLYSDPGACFFSLINIATSGWRYVETE